MKGSSLYEVYREELMKAGLGRIETPLEWPALMTVEQNAWNELAKFVESLVYRAAR